MNVAAYVDDVRAAFEPNLERGMRRIAQAIERCRIEALAHGQLDAKPDRESGAPH